VSARVHISDDLRGLPGIVEETFGAALVDDVAPAIAQAWKGQIVALDVIDSRTYLDNVAPGEAVEGAEGLTVEIESVPASGYASAIKRGRAGSYDYVGRRVAEQGIEAADGDIRAALDKAGKKVQG
jgi:hypothetical protein